jgi:Holliday junction resolvase-like predicted endonuclease
MWTEIGATMNKLFHCPCLTIKVNKERDVLNQFDELRENCEALSKILLPDDIWPSFKKRAAERVDEANHCSILLSAFKDGCLDKITSIIHKYLLEYKIQISIKSGYLQDLKDTWINSRNFLRRHQRSREYYGKIIELFIANWLEKQGWKILNLEATCGKADIEASSPDNIPHDIEVKYIGQEDYKFLAMVSTQLTKEKFSSLEENIIAQEINGSKKDNIKKSFEKADSRNFDPFCGANYILFRTYEAAKQLQKLRNELEIKLVIIVISNLEWPFLQIPIKDNFIDWMSPTFLNECTEWEDFYNKIIIKEYPQIENDLQSTIQSLNQLWIIKEESYFNFCLKCIVNLKKVM